jgi:signal transduction histidine kinase
MAVEHGLTRRLGRELLLQAVYISIAVLVGIYVVAILLKDVLIEQALTGEANYYWERVDENPAAVLPDTLNLTAYREGFGIGVPLDLRPLEPGYHQRKTPRETLTYVTERNGQRLYLVFESGQVNDLVTTFGIVPLAIALTVIYLSLFSAYRVSRRAVSPLIDLANRVKRLDPTQPDARLFGESSGYQKDDEARTLAEALEGLVNRVVEFAERERRFTRDASHELRTPLTVINIAAGRLLRAPGLGDADRESLMRIKNSARDMEQLTSAFLLLARESNSTLEKELVNVNELVQAELDRSKVIQPDKGLVFNVDEQKRAGLYGRGQCQRPYQSWPGHHRRYRSGHGAGRGRAVIPAVLSRSAKARWVRCGPDHRQAPYGSVRVASQHRERTRPRYACECRVPRSSNWVSGISLRAGSVPRALHIFFT